MRYLERDKLNRLYFRAVSVDGTPVNIANISEVEIRNLNNTLITTLTPIEESQGVWYVDWDIPVSQEVNLYNDIWKNVDQVGIRVSDESFRFIVIKNTITEIPLYTINGVILDG